MLSAEHGQTYRRRILYPLHQYIDNIMSRGRISAQSKRVGALTDAIAKRTELKSNPVG